MHRTPLLRLYRLATQVLLPVFAKSERRKVIEHGVSAERAAEKLGCATQARPKGRLIWVHAASVGEGQSVLRLIQQIGVDRPDLAFLITSGTPTSAKVLAQRLPPRTLHQFAPLDAPGPVDRFLQYWRPDAALFVESELWPNMLMSLSDQSVPTILINARMSDASLARWQAWRKTARVLLGCFTMIRTQTAALAKAFTDLAPATTDVAEGVRLKSLAAPLPQNARLYEDVSHALGARPVWVAASTHPGEDSIVLDAHAALLRDWPELCLILAPRHPERADDIARLITARGWPDIRRSRHDPVAGPVYLADSLGEMGTWYALAKFVVLGGSFAPKGGHNPYEVIRAGVPLLTGPDVRNCAEDMAWVESEGAAVRLETPDALLPQMRRWLAEPAQLLEAQRAAQGMSLGSETALAAISHEILDAFNLESANA